MRTAAQAIGIGQAAARWRTGESLVFILILVLTAFRPCWSDEGGLFMGMYGDSRGRQVGDTLHLIITETSSATMTADQTQKQNTAANIGPGLGKLDFLKSLGWQTNSNLSASGSSSRGGNMTARMTVRVMEVTPAGNLVVQGERAVSVNNDKEIIRIKGEVRRKDVLPDNSIYSYDLANVQIDYVGTDPRKPGKKGGIITQLLGFLF